MSKIQCIGGYLDGQFVEDKGYYFEYCSPLSYCLIPDRGYFDDLYYNVIEKRQRYIKVRIANGITQYHIE